MAKTVKAKYEITADDKSAATLKKVRANFRKLGQDVQNVGRNMAMGMSLPIVAFGASSLKASANFETSMNKVRAISNVTGKTLEDMKQQAKDLGRTTQFSASEAADAMGFLSMAGFKANEVMGAMPSTLQLAAAAQMDLADAADISSNILTGYGLSVEDLAHSNDVLIKTTNSSNTNLAQLGAAMSKVGPMASGLGLSLEETSAALGMLGNAGIQAEMAGTTLKSALAAMASPVGVAGAKMKELGINAMDANGKMIPLKDVFKQLEMSGATAGDMMTMFGQKAGPGMMALVKQGSGAFEKLKGDLEGSGGTAAKAAAIQMEGLGGAIKELKSAFEALQIAIGDSGLLEWFTSFVKKITAIISKASSANKSLMKMSVGFGLIAAAIGPMLMLLGKMMVLYGDWPKKMLAVKKAMNGLKGTFGVLQKSIMGMNVATLGWVAVAAAVLAAMLVIWANWGDDIKAFLSKMWGGITKFWDDSLGWIKQATADSLEFIGGIWDWLKNTIFKAMKPVISWLLKAYSKAYGFMIEGLGKVIKSFGKLLTWVAKAPGAPQWIKDMAEDVDSFGKSVEGFGENLDLGKLAKGGLEKLKGGVSGVVSFIEGVDWEGAWGGMKDGMSSQGDLIKGQLVDMMAGLGIDGLIANLGGGGGMGGTGEGGGESSSTGGGETSPAEQKAVEQLSRIQQKFKETFGNMRSIADQIADAMADTFMNVANGLSDVLGGAIGDLATNMLGLTEGPIMIGRAFKSMAAGVIKDLVGMIVKMYIVSAIARALGFSVGKIPMDTVTGGASLAGTRAGGGDVEAGRSYMVGENGPERWTAPANGHITANKDLGSSLTIGNLNLSLNTTLSDDPITIRRVAEDLYDELKKVGQMHGPEAASV